MTTLFERELIVIARTPALWLGLAAHVVIAAGFVIVWGDGLPIQGGGSVFDQFLTTQSAALAIVLPWVAVRCGAPWGRDGVVELSVAAATSPSIVVLARCLAVASGLFLVAAASLPFASIVLQVSALPLTHLLLPTLVPSFALACIAAVAATMCSVLTPHRLLAWVAATLVTVSAVAAGGSGMTSAVVFFLAAVIAAAFMAQWVGARLTCWNDQTPLRSAHGRGHD